MKKLAVLIILFFPAWCMAQDLNKSLARAVESAFIRQQVKVDIKFAKPVYMSDVMLRPVRGGKDTVIRKDYKQVTCFGRLSKLGTYVYVSTSCVTEKKYHIEKVRLTFADGTIVEQLGSSVRRKDDKLTRIKLK